MRLLLNGKVVAEITTNHSMSIEDAAIIAFGLDSIDDQKNTGDIIQQWQ